MWDTRWLLEVDWKRFSEMVMSLVHMAGYHVGDSVIRMDGSVRFQLFRSAELRKHLSLVHCAAWEHPWVSPEDVRDLAAALTRGMTGVLITPGAFSPAAREVAEELGIERVAGVDLIRMIWQLTPEEQHYLLQLTTAGEYTRPTCPCCQQKLVLGKFPDENLNISKKICVFRRSVTVNHDINVDKVIIKKRAHVTFLRPVKAKAMEVYGSVTGNFIVDGLVRIASGATLSGLLAAKSIDALAGSSLDGTAQILPRVEAVAAAPRRMVWYCETRRLSRHCSKIRLKARQLILTEQHLLDLVSESP